MANRQTANRPVYEVRKDVDKEVAHEYQALL